jgi:hypothetical protein
MGNAVVSEICICLLFMGIHGVIALFDHEILNFRPFYSFGFLVHRLFMPIFERIKTSLRRMTSKTEDRAVFSHLFHTTEKRQHLKWQGKKRFSCIVFQE